MLKKEEIRIRDPFVLVDRENSCYYMYGTTALEQSSIYAFNTYSVYKTEDLENFSEPKIIFADEPTGNLDSHTTIEILEFLQRIVREQNKTLIMVSHDAEVAMYADRIVHMLDGRITSIEDNRANAVSGSAAAISADEIKLETVCEQENEEVIQERGTEEK